LFRKGLTRLTAPRQLRSFKCRYFKWGDQERFSWWM